MNREKFEKTSNRREDAVEKGLSIFRSLASKVSGLPGVKPTTSKPQTISPAALAFANRYRHLKDRTRL